jgi:hypothetical protein
MADSGWQIGNERCRAASFSAWVCLLRSRLLLCLSAIRYPLSAIRFPHERSSPAVRAHDCATSLRGSESR